MVMTTQAEGIREMQDQLELMCDKLMAAADVAKINEPVDATLKATLAAVVEVAKSVNIVAREVERLARKC